MYALGMPIRQVSRDAYMIEVAVAYVPLPVDCSPLKPESTSGFKPPAAPPPCVTHFTCLLQQASHQQIREGHQYELGLTA